MRQPRRRIRKPHATRRTPAGRLPDARRTAAGRTGSGLPLRQDAVDPGFHCVRTGPAHPDRDADGADVPWVRFLGRAARPRFTTPWSPAEPAALRRA